MDTTMERDPLTLSLRLMLHILVMDILMPSELTIMLPMFPSAPALVLTQSPKVSTPSPRELFLTMVWAIMDTTMERDLLMPSQRLMLMLHISAMDILMPSELMAMLLMFHLAPALVLTQSPRDLTQSPRELFLTMVWAIMDTTMA